VLDFASNKWLKEGRFAAEVAHMRMSVPALLASGLMALAVSGPARAGVNLYDTLAGNGSVAGPSGIFAGTVSSQAVSIGSSGPLGNSFTTGNTSWTLTGIDLVLAPGGTGGFTVNLASNTAAGIGNPDINPADWTQLAIVSDAVLAASPAITTSSTYGNLYGFSVDQVLAAGTQYWIFLSGVSSGTSWVEQLVTNGDAGLVNVNNEYNYYTSVGANNTFPPFEMSLTGTVAPGASSVPEPSSMAIMLVPGMVAFGLWRSRPGRRCWNCT